MKTIGRLVRMAAYGSVYLGIGRELLLEYAMARGRYWAHPQYKIAHNQR
jgi:hypothetical protein